MESLTISNEEKNEIRRYLLGQLEDADAERLELRLLTDGAFSEQFDTIVDEIADQYAADEFKGEERAAVEQYFLSAPERRQKVQFARELQQLAAVELAAERASVAPPPPGLFERLNAFWTSQSIALRTATVAATIVIVAGLAFLIRPVFFGTDGTDVFLTLNFSAGERAQGAEVRTVKLDPRMRALRITLMLPEQSPQEQNYRVELLDDQEQPRNLPVAERTLQSVVVAIPANELRPGTYIIHLYVVKPDDTGDRIHGGYFFNVS